MRRTHRNREQADIPQLRALLRAGDEAVEVPGDLWQRVGAGAPRRPEPLAPRRPRRRTLTLIAAAAAVVVTAVVATTASGLLGAHRPHTPSLGAGRPGITLAVYNAEVGCQPLHTIECSLSLLGNPHARYVAANTVGRVWHGEKVVTDCVVPDGTEVVDEAGVSSLRWYHVTLPDGTVGWLPGVRTRNSTEVPLCATDPTLSPGVSPGRTSTP